VADDPRAVAVTRRHAIRPLPEVGFALVVRPLVELSGDRRCHTKEENQDCGQRARQKKRKAHDHYFDAMVTMPAVLSMVTVN